MPEEVFIDSAAWVAVNHARDRAHQAAIAAYRGLLRGPRVLVTTNLVVGESYELIRRHAGQPTAMRFLRALRESARVAKIYSDEGVEQQAEQILRRYADQDFSYVDAVSFAVMRQRGITEAFTFDHHFLVAGFVVVPG